MAQLGYCPSEDEMLAEVEAAKPMLDDGMDWDTREARLDIEVMVDLLSSFVAYRGQHLNDIWFDKAQAVIDRAWQRGI